LSISEIQQHYESSQNYEIATVCCTDDEATNTVLSAIIQAVRKQEQIATTMTQQ